VERRERRRPLKLFYRGVIEHDRPEQAGSPVDDSVRGRINPQAGLSGQSLKPRDCLPCGFVMVARGHRNLGFGSATLGQHRFGMRLADSLEVAAADDASAPALGKIDFEQFELERGTPAIEYEYFHATASL
jgi:hypothetical protein